MYVHIYIYTCIRRIQNLLLRRFSRDLLDVFGFVLDLRGDMLGNSLGNFGKLLGNVEKSWGNVKKSIENNKQLDLLGFLFRKSWIMLKT